MRLSASICAYLVSVTVALAGCGGGEQARTSAGEPASEVGPPMFVDVTSDLGIDFAIDRAASGDYFMPDSMGAGCALLDYDNDGDLDLYVVNGFRAADGRTVTEAGANRLYRQESDGRFTDVTSFAGVGDRGYGMGVATGDYDNDGHIDLFVTNFGPNRLYANDGDGTFTDVTDRAGLGGMAGDAWSTSAGFFDADGDGDLDLWVANYLVYETTARSRDAAGRLEYSSPGAFPGVADVFYRNRGDGYFRDASVEAGIADNATRGLGVVFTDLDADGHVDVYVANDGEANAAWINDGNGVFTDRAARLGLAVNAYGVPEASMGIAVGDRDGRVELFLTHLVRESNTLYRERAAGQFDDATMAADLAAPSIDETGFGTAFADLDLDGDLDLAVVNGRVLRKHPHAGATLSRHWTPYAEPNQVFLDDGSGRYVEIEAGSGAFCTDVEVSRGLAVGDVDGDGDPDLVVTNGNGTVRVYRNDAPPAEAAWLAVRVFDPMRGHDAIGAVVEVHVGERAWRRTITTAGSYLSASDVWASFGLGDATGVDAIVVVWPDGTRERFEGGPVNERRTLRKRGGA